MENPEALDSFIPTIRAALALNVSVNTIYRWTNFKTFPETAVKRLKGANVYNVEEIRKWLDTRKRSYRFTDAA